MVPWQCLGCGLDRGDGTGDSGFPPSQMEYERQVASLKAASAAENDFSVSQAEVSSRQAMLENASDIKVRVAFPCVQGSTRSPLHGPVARDVGVCMGMQSLSRARTLGGSFHTWSPAILSKKIEKSVAVEGPPLEGNWWDRLVVRGKVDWEGPAK